MKRLIIFSIILTTLTSCHNQDISFPDYKYTAGYFPYQYPVRTLLLGSDILYDNSNDNAHRFVISATMGGVYENNEIRTFTFRVDESLCDRAYFPSGKAVRPLPQNYYTLSSPDKIVIEPGNISGGVTVQLTDAFFNDPEAISLSYVIPLRLIAVAGLDSLLSGSPSVSNPDPRVSGDWSIAPKNFTMFGIKFRNPYDGTFLHRGVTTVSGSVNSTAVYHKPYVENDDLRTIATTGKNKVSFTNPVRIPGKSGTLSIDLIFSDSSIGDATCSIQGTAVYDGRSVPVTGTGAFVQGKESWGGKQRDALYLSFSGTDDVNGLSFSVRDTLVLRDRSMAVETFNVSLK